MPKKISNDIEREQPLGEDVEPSTTPDIISAVEPVKKKKQLSEEQREKQRANLEKGRLALAAKREAAIQERAKMLHDAVTDAPPKAKKEDKKLKQILEAVANIPNEDEETENEIVVVKKKKIPKRTIVIHEEEDEQQQPPPPPPVAEKPKRQYRKKEKVDLPKAEAPVPVSPVPAQAPKPSVIFY